MNDIYFQFINDNIEIAYEDQNQILKVNELYTRFKDWYKQFYPNMTCPDRPIFIEEIDARLIQKSLRGDSKYWIGVKIKQYILIL